MRLLVIKRIDDTVDYIVEGGMNCIYNTNEQLIKIINPQYRGKKYRGKKILLF